MSPIEPGQMTQMGQVIVCVLRCINTLRICGLMDVELTSSLQSQLTLASNIHVLEPVMMEALTTPQTGKHKPGQSKLYHQVTGETGCGGQCKGK